jgi:D-alanyl-lipoteichoic acid acyltransferase DltB (MBOAT superfamily)
VNVPSLQFLAFAIVGAIVFNLRVDRLWGRLVLLLLNLAFFCTFLHGAASAVPYLSFLAVGYLGVMLLYRNPSSLSFSLILALLLGGFFVLKRYSFVPPSIEIPFPYATVGLSYVFFRVLHLVIDAWQGALPASVGPLSYANYTLNFTALVSGPIQLYPDYRRSETGPRLPLDLFVIAAAFERIVIGFFKVAIVSTLLMKFQHAALDRLSPELDFGGRVLDFALICATYPLFLYANFSGYTDCVIGVARLYRIALPENFDWPFLSENFIAFWGRWHITLSNWLKTYVYTPLLMTAMRRMPAPSLEPYLGVVAYFVTFFLVGAWHGQTSMFLFFGVLQGGGVAANKLYQVLMTAWLSRRGYRALAANPLYAAASRGLTFTWFAVTMFWFWSSWDQLAGFVATAGWGAIGAALGLVLVAAAAILSICQALIARRDARAAREDEVEDLPSPSRYWRTMTTTAMIVIIAAFTLIANGPAPDVVYKNF